MRRYTFISIVLIVFVWFFSSCAVSNNSGGSVTTDPVVKELRRIERQRQIDEYYRRSRERIKRYN